MDRSAVYNDPGMLERVTKMGQVFAMSGLFGVRNVDQGIVFAIEMVTNNRSPFEMMQTWHVLGDKVTKQASAMLAHFNELGGKHSVVEYSPDAVEIHFQKGDGNPLKVRITYQEALQEKWPYGKAGQIKDNWAAPLQRASMLFARVTTRGIRAVCPQVNAGTYAPEEIDDDGVVTPNYSTFGNEQTAMSPKIVRDDENGACSQVQLDSIQRLGNDVAACDPGILQKVKSQLDSMGKTLLSQLTWKEAAALEAALQKKIAEAVIAGESQAATAAE